MKGITIAIDGPVASGKGTIAPLLAKRLKGFYLQTGAMYRCVALYCLNAQVGWSEEKAVVVQLPNITIAFQGDAVLLNGADVTEEIRREVVGMASSKIAMMPSVREDMLSRQQHIAREKLQQGMPVIAEGRDTGTKLFPETTYKIFLTATPEIRARRRVAQIQAQGRTGAVYTTVLKELLERDEQDQERKTDPLVKDPEKHGYTVIDNSRLTEEETIEKILSLIEEE
jgi:CMP/dCMP kinase